MEPYQKVEEWNRKNSITIFAGEGRPPTSFGPLGDPNDVRAKMPLSPLDRSFPPIAGYLVDPYCTQTIVRPRDAFSPRYHVLRACGQCEPIPIDLIFDSLDDVYKVNEGVFGEVYSGLFNGAHDESVYKVVPIEGNFRVNGEMQKRFEQIETEIRVSQRLNTLWSRQGRNATEGFCYLYRARVVIGAYPRVLLHAWKDWHYENSKSSQIRS